MLFMPEFPSRIFRHGNSVMQRYCFYVEMAKYKRRLLVLYCFLATKIGNISETQKKNPGNRQKNSWSPFHGVFLFSIPFPSFPV